MQYDDGCLKKKDFVRNPTQEKCKIDEKKNGKDNFIEGLNLNEKGENSPPRVAPSQRVFPFIAEHFLS